MPEFTEIFAFFNLCLFITSQYKLQLQHVYRRGRLTRGDAKLSADAIHTRNKNDSSRHPSFEPYIGWLMHSVYFKTADMVWILAKDNPGRRRAYRAVTWSFGTGTCWVWVHRSYINHHLFLMEDPSLIPPGYSQNLNMVFSFQDTDMVLCLCDCSTVINQVSYKILALDEPWDYEQHCSDGTPDIFSEFPSYVQWSHQKFGILASKSGSTTLGQMLSLKSFSRRVFGKGLGRYHSTEVLDRIWISYRIPAVTTLRSMLAFNLFPIVLAVVFSFYKEVTMTKRDYNPLVRNCHRIIRFRRRLQLHGKPKLMVVLKDNIRVRRTQPTTNELAKRQYRVDLDDNKVLGVGNADYATHKDTESNLLPERHNDNEPLPACFDFRVPHTTWNTTLSRVPHRIAQTQPLYCPLRSDTIDSNYQVVIQSPLTSHYPTMDEIMAKVYAKPVNQSNSNVLPAARAATLRGCAVSETLLQPTQAAHLVSVMHVAGAAQESVDKSKDRKRKRARDRKSVPEKASKLDKLVAETALHGEISTEDYSGNSAHVQASLVTKKSRPNKQTRLLHLQNTGRYGLPILYHIVEILQSSNNEIQCTADSVRKILHSASVSRRRVLHSSAVARNVLLNNTNKANVI